MTDSPRELEVAVRAWATPNYVRYRDRYREVGDGPARGYRDLGPSDWTLTFDSETTTDLSLRLRVGCYQLRRTGRLREAGFFIDADELTDDDLIVIRRYTQERGLRLLTRAEFVTKVFFPYAYTWRALGIGFNLPFDLPRLAIDHGPAKDATGTMRGGFSFRFSNNPMWPHVQMKKSGANSFFIRFTVPVGRSAEQRNRERGGDLDQHRGYFVDVSQVAGPLLGKRYSLKRLAEVLETEHQKLDEEHGSSITGDYLRYLERDVLVTWECFEKLRDRYATLGLTQTPLHGVFSEASLGKALLREAGLTPWRELQPSFPDGVLATIMESYYGGRSECLIRRSPRHGVYVDFTSEYPTVFVLQGLCDYLVSIGIEWEEEDPGIAQRMLDELTTEDVLRPETWRELHALVLVDPDGAKLPTRARYRMQAGIHGLRRGFNLGMARRQGGVPQWYALADCCASKVETGRAPRVLRVIRFRPADRRQTDLCPIDLAGDPRYRVDLERDDIIKRLVELRASIQRDQAAAEADGDAAEAERLEGIQKTFKVQANGIAYGIPIELNVIEHPRPVDVTVHLPDGSTYLTRSDRTEHPGRWFHPLIATLVSSGGRLLLATAIALVRAQGGNYAFCDTDSLFIVDLTLQEVEDIVRAFDSLNPYDKTLIPDSILKIEEENFDPITGEPADMSCFAIAAKRYALFTLDQDGYPRLIGDVHKRRRSEHGLGHLLLPIDPELGSGPAYDQWWEHLIATELGLDHDEPDYFGQIAVGRLTISSVRAERDFRAYNRGRPYNERVRPGSFGLMAHLAPTQRVLHQATCLVAPYKTDPVERLRQRWINRKKPDHTCNISTDDAVDDDTITVQTLRDYFNEYRLHTDAKMLGPDANRCHPWTRGCLQSPVVTAIGTLRVGKESNPLTESTETNDSVGFEYAQRRCHGCGAPINGRGGRPKFCVGDSLR